MSDEIEFGEVEQLEHARRLRPDRNAQLAIVACGRPDAADLPIFVELDAMRDVEQHALSDVHAELGGVLLGGQSEDQEGRPFVIVEDSLRAAHYENTRGSFKFTHQTWEDITRRREQFPAGLQMVGWYHTHPGWGVFLSGMDSFICEHFFNRPLDVALVVDPCRAERGWFQWSGDSREPLRRTGGFYLFASRHRRAELEAFARGLEGHTAMAHDPPNPGSPGPDPIVITAGTDSRGAWLALAVVGMLALQFALLALIAWKLLAPAPAAPAGGPSELAALQAWVTRLEELTDQDRRRQQLDAQRELLDRVVAQLSQDGPQGLVQSLEQQRQESAGLMSDLHAHRAREASLLDENRTLAASLDQAEQTQTDLQQRVADQGRELKSYHEREQTARRRLADLENRLASVEARAAGGEAPIRTPRWWMWAGGGALASAVLVLGCLLPALRRRRSLTDQKPDGTDPAAAPRDGEPGDSSPSGDAIPESRPQGEPSP
jgi:proteasome lid subunit RPN8/RPN11